MPDTNDVVKEAREFIAIVGNCGLYPDKAQRIIVALADEVEQLTAWKESAAALLQRYDRLAETFNGPIASSKVENLATSRRQHDARNRHGYEVPRMVGIIMDRPTYSRISHKGTGRTGAGGSSSSRGDC